jgi:hypothetical protein
MPPGQLAEAVPPYGLVIGIALATAVGWYLGTGMGLVWLVIAIVLVLGIAALVKYLVFR